MNSKFDSKKNQDHQIYIELTRSSLSKACLVLKPQRFFPDKKQQVTTTVLWCLSLENSILLQEI